MECNVKEDKQKMKNKLQDLIGLGHIQKAKDILIQYKTIFSEDEDEYVYLSEGQIAISEKRFAEAEKILCQALAVNCRNPEILYNIAYVYYQTGRLHQAVVKYQQALTLLSDDDMVNQISHIIKEIQGMPEYKTIQQNLTSIIILTFNKLDYTKLCIESIRQYTELDSYEIIVIDNHSTDGTVEWLLCQEDIRLILNSENVGFPKGCNQGIKVANGNSILLLNNDTIVTPNWLSNLKKCLLSSSDIGAVGAVTNSCSNFQGIPCDYSSLEEMIHFARQLNISNPELWENRARLVGYCMLIKSELVSKIGLLEENFSPGNYEDDDYSLRIRKAGYRLVLCRDTFIHHFGSVSFLESAQLNMLFQNNRQKFIEKWGIDPHSIPLSELTEDVALKKWFTYQYEYKYYKQLMETAGIKFLSLIHQAEFALLSGNCEKAALLVKQAADFAHHCHPGFFASPDLELILSKVAKKINDSVAIPINIPPKTSDQRNILHVLSQGYSSGEHTRTLERWINMDSQSTHSILVTLNSTTNPQWVVDAAIHAGGWYHTLDTTNLNLCQRARVLRDVAAMWADIVVLHIHPHDPIAPIAFGVPGGPPVIFSNHADQAFTIGMSAADIVAENRSTGQLITLTRRNITKSYKLPIPLGTIQHLQDKKIARAALGINQDKIVLLTVALPHKLVPCGEYNFYTLLREIIKRHQNIEILVVGPSDAGEWTQLKNESNGRIRAFTMQQDLNLFYSAADVYLDSIPFGSSTAALEAGALGIPVVGLATEIAMHLSSDIAPEFIKTHFYRREELFAAIDRLISDEVYRTNQGEYLKSAIIQNHYLGWTKHLNTLYSLLPPSHQPAEISGVNRQNINDIDVIWAYIGYTSGSNRSRFG